MTTDKFLLYVLIFNLGVSIIKHDFSGICGWGTAMFLQIRRLIAS